MKTVVHQCVTAALVATSVAANSANAQTLADQIAAVPDGTVRLSFAAREDVCGSGDHVYVSHPHDTDDWVSDCERGPVRVAMRVRGGTVMGVDAYVGGRWRARRGVTDLGTVSVRDAAAYLLDLVPTLGNESGKEALSAAAIADSVDVWRDLARIARDADRSLDIRESAVFWLGQTPDDAVVAVLEDMLASAIEHDIKEKVIFALSQHQSDRATSILEELARRPGGERDLREKAIFWLGQSRGNDEGEFLRDLYGRIDDRELREKVIFSVSQRRGEENARWLIRLVLDDDEPTEFRKKAVFWLGQTRGSRDELFELYDRISSRELREQLIFVYSQRRDDEEALEKLMTIARGDEDWELRRKAIFWLGQSRDARAIEFLAELINR
jgi:HEAT repeat protein